MLLIHIDVRQIGYQVLGTKNLVPSTWYTKYSVPSTWYLVLGTKCLVPSTWYKALGMKYLVPSGWYPVRPKLKYKSVHIGFIALMPEQNQPP